jgi:site-specific DNA-methyltransferase (adenine-specific)
MRTRIKEIFMKVTDKIEITTEDNMELMARYPDNYFDLAIVDPPYGIGISSNPVRQKHKKKNWDNETPTKKYFEELFRVSKNQIIWGGNYFDLPITQGFFIWDKKQPHDFSLAMCEYAWSSIQKPAKMWSLSIHKEQNKIHPTQKPIELYKWLLENNAKQGDKILDTHLGSGSIAIACHDYGFELTACELDLEYYEKAVERINNHVAQLKLF